MVALVDVRPSSDRRRGAWPRATSPGGEIIAEFRGPEVTKNSLDGLPREAPDLRDNIGSHRYLLVREPAVRTNLSCDPNAGIAGDRQLVALRDIRQGEEVTFDYALITADDWEMQCACGAPNCRRVIGNYRDLAESWKRKYAHCTPEWIKPC